MEEQAEQPQVDPQGFIRFVTESGNLAAEIDEQQASEIARDVCEDYELDHESMSDWRTRMKRGIELATLIKKDKDYPFSGAANVKYPLVTSAALQFNARAYPAIVPSTDLVKAKIWGDDPSGQKAARGARVSSYLSWQLSTEVEEWDRETDKLLVQLPIVGDMFRKVWWDGTRARCKLVDPGKFVINANVQNLTDAPRGSEEMTLYPHEIKTRIKTGFFVEFDYDEDDEDKHAPIDFIEQHLRLDLDDDGYPEPYIATVCRERQTLVRLVADFEASDVDFATETRQVPGMAQQPVGMDVSGQPIMAQVPTVQDVDVTTGINSITRNSYFVHYQFMPGMDEGLFGTGLGLLLGDISDSINTSLNMMIDAGHYASLGGGFIGSEFRMKGGAQRMKPGEWKKVEGRGGDVRSSMVPMTFPGADPVMFQMMGLLIDAGKEVSSTSDIMVGDTGGKNMTATTTLALIEQGMKVFTAAYKRVFRSLQREYALFCRINAQTLSPEKYNAFLDGEQPANPQDDFNLVGMDIHPVADPNAVTKMQEMAKAGLLMDMAQNGQVNPAVASARILEAAGIDDIEELIPQPDPMQQQMQAMQMQGMQADLAQKMADIELTLSKVESEKAKAMKDVSDIGEGQRSRRFDEVMKILEMQRDDLARQLEQSRGGMEGTPGNGTTQNGASLAVGPQAGGNYPVLLAGE